MHDVVVYLSSLPKIADAHRKLQVLTAFAQGAKKLGANVLVQSEYKVVPARLSVILGWVGTKISGPHIELRRSVIATQQSSGNYVMPIDSSCFKFVDTGSQYLRYSLNGVFYSTSDYANANSTSKKWNQLQAAFPQLVLKPWRTHGDHVLVCLQRDGGWSMKGTDMSAWAYNMVQRVRQHTKRPILVRPHPKAKIDLKAILTIPNVFASNPTHNLQQDLVNAWASVFYNSSSSVAAALAGIPVFAEDPDCVAWKICNSSLGALENPLMPEREQWLYDLSAAHWSDAESTNGDIYGKFLPTLIPAL